LLLKKIRGAIIGIDFQDFEKKIKKMNPMLLK